MRRHLEIEEIGAIGICAVSLIMMVTIVIMIVRDHGRPSAEDQARKIDPAAQCVYQHPGTSTAVCAANRKWYACSPSGCAEAPDGGAR